MRAPYAPHHRGCTTATPTTTGNGCQDTRDDRKQKLYGSPLFERVDDLCERWTTETAARRTKSSTRAQNVSQTHGRYEARRLTGHRKTAYTGRRKLRIEAARARRRESGTRGQPLEPSGQLEHITGGIASLLTKAQCTRKQPRRGLATPARTDAPASSFATTRRHRRHPPGSLLFTSTPTSTFTARFSSSLGRPTRSRDPARQMRFCFCFFLRNTGAYYSVVKNGSTRLGRERERRVRTLWRGLEGSGGVGWVSRMVLRV